MEKIIDYYREQGPRTKVKPWTFIGFPDDIKGICTIIQHLLVHPGNLKLYKLQLDKERIADLSKKTIQECIDKIMEINNKPLTEHREPQDRIVNICKHFSMFTCSVLREKWIPARCRCWFATYFSGWRFEDHWICEYWNNQQHRRIRVDTQMDEMEITECHINQNTINWIDLPKEAFFSWGVLWKLYRMGVLSGNLCGYSLEENEHGNRYIRGNMLRDFFALHKIEYTYGETSKLMERKYTPKKNELLVLDEIADLTINTDTRFDELLKFYEQHKELRP